MGIPRERKLLKFNWLRVSSKNLTEEGQNTSSRRKKMQTRPSKNSKLLQRKLQHTKNAAGWGDSNSMGIRARPNWSHPLPLSNSKAPFSTLRWGSEVHRGPFIQWASPLSISRWKIIQFRYSQARGNSRCKWLRAKGITLSNLKSIRRVSKCRQRKYNFSILLLPPTLPDNYLK